MMAVTMFEQMPIRMSEQSRFAARIQMPDDWVLSGETTIIWPPDSDRSREIEGLFLVAEGSDWERVRSLPGLSCVLRAFSGPEEMTLSVTTMSLGDGLFGRVGVRWAGAMSSRVLLIPCDSRFFARVQMPDGRIFVGRTTIVWRVRRDGPTKPIRLTRHVHGDFEIENHLTWDKVRDMTGPPFGAMRVYSGHDELTLDVAILRFNHGPSGKVFIQWSGSAPSTCTLATYSVFSGGSADSSRP